MSENLPVKPQLEVAFYQVHFTYHDGKDLKIQMAPAQLNDFFKELNDRKIYWYGGEKEVQPEQGFWTDLSQVRFIQFHAIKGVRHEGPGNPPAPQNPKAEANVSPEQAEAKPAHS